MSSYIIITLLLSVFTFAIIIMFAVMQFKKTPTQIQSSEHSARIQDIMVSPIRPTIFASAFIFIGILFSYLIFSGFLLPPDFSEPYTYISIIMGLAGIAMIMFGIYMFLRRNMIIQLRLDTNGLYYTDIDWTPSRKRNAIGIVLKKPVKYISYNDINQVVVRPDAMYGDSIYIYANTGDGFYLPYLGDSNSSVREIHQLIQRRIG